MTVLIVEDEIAAQRNLISVLAKVAPDLEVVGTTESVTETVEWLMHQPLPGIIFMDIHLADGHAFRIFDIIEVKAPVIFTTAYDQYALEAFRVNSVDYLLKPIKASDVAQALSKHRHIANIDLIERLKKAVSLPSGSSCRLLIPYKDKIIPLPADDIAFLYTTNERTHVATIAQKIYPLEKSLDSMMAQLPETDFYRANRQFIISRRAIKDIDMWIGSRLSVNLVVKTPERVVVSKNRVAEFKGWLASR